MVGVDKFLAESATEIQKLKDQPPEPQLPVYRIGLRDQLEVRVEGIDDLTRDVRLNPDGTASLALIGPVKIFGMTIQEAEQTITGLYGKDLLQNPKVSITVKDYTLASTVVTVPRYTVAGAVGRTGVFQIAGPLTLMQAIAAAGDPGAIPDIHNLLLIRTLHGERVGARFDLDKIRLGEAQDPSILDQDVIFLPRAPVRVVLKDSLFRDLLDLINPFSYLGSYLGSSISKP